MDRGAWSLTMGSLKVGRNWATSLSCFTFMHWRRKWRPTPVFLPGESQDGGAWWAAVYGVAQSQTWLKRLSSSSRMSMDDNGNHENGWGGREKRDCTALNSRLIQKSRFVSFDLQFTFSFGFHLLKLNVRDQVMYSLSEYKSSYCHSSTSPFQTCALFACILIGVCSVVRCIHL